MVLEVNGKRFEVAAWVPESAGVADSQKPAKARRPGSSNSRTKSGSGQVTVPMQGTIVKVLVKVGQEVSEGDAVVVLEAMKMENNIKSPCDGVIKAVPVAHGTAVEKKEILIEFE